MSRAREAVEGVKWQGTEKLWTNRVGKNWVAKRVLGRGGQGIVGHWTYEGPDRDAKALKDIVVKQSAAGDGLGLSREALALEYFKGSGSPHIIKMYRHLYRERGNGSMELDKGLVHRLFMEYCPGGDLEHWMQKKFDTKSVITEVEMWAIFHCLARGALVMHTGSEDTSCTRWDKDIVHFDIKSPNVLLGALATDNEHRNAPVFKFADFGLAADVPQVQDSDYQDLFAWCGTRQYFAPEQRKKFIRGLNFERPWVTSSGNLLTSFNYGSHTNVWQIGLLMLCLKHRMHSPLWQRSMLTANHINLYQSTHSNRLKRGGLTLGYPKDIGEETDGSLAKYSIGLNALIKECLLIQPPSRPTPEALVARTKRGLERCHRNAGMSLSTVPSAAPIHPQPSSRWFSQDLHPEFERKPAPQRTLKLSELPMRIEEAQKEAIKQRHLEIPSHGIAKWLNFGRFNRPPRGFAAQRSNPFSLSGGAGRIQRFNASVPLGLGAGAAAGVAAGVAAGIGVGLGAGFELVKEQLQAGVNAGVNRLAEAFNPPPENYDWEVLLSNKGKGPEPVNEVPPPDEEALVPIPELICIVRTVGVFGGVTHSHVKLNGLFKGTTFLQLKGKLMASGVNIPLHQMKITCGARIFKDDETLAELAGRNTIRVEMI